MDENGKLSFSGNVKKDAVKTNGNTTSSVTAPSVTD
jgi:hypothetical protein